MVHYRTHKRPTPVSILGQPNPVHITTSHLLEIHPNIIHPSTPRSPQWSLTLRFPHQDPLHSPSPHPYAPHTQPISIFSILSPAQYWVSSTNHLAPRYAVSSTPTLPRRSSGQTFSSTHLNTLQIFHIHTEFATNNHLKDPRLYSLMQSSTHS